MIHSAYVIDYETIKKVLPEEIKYFEEKANNLLVYFNLSTDYNFNLKDILEHCAIDDLEGSRFYRLLSNEDYHDVEDKLQEIYNLMCYEKNSITNLFFKKTNIRLNIDYNYESESVFFYLNSDDVVYLSPAAQKLKKNGIDFNFEVWQE